MKASNKLLVSFFLIVLTVPLCFLWAMKTKVKKAEFTMENQHSIVSGRLGNYKVIKIDGIGDPNMPNVVSCRIRPSSSSEYEYTDFNYEKSHLTITELGDTIFIKYNATPDHKSYVYYDVQINLYIPDMSNIVVSNATAIIDSINLRLPKMINVELQNGAALYVGTDLQGINRRLGKANKDGSYTALPKPVSTIQTLDSLNIVGGAGSKVVLGEVFIKNLILDMQSYSSLEIPLNLNIDNISGKISAEASVKTNIKGLKALQPLLR